MSKISDVELVGESMPKISDVELKELAKLYGTPWASVAQECITARELIPAIDAECKRLHEENLDLKQTLHEYANMQIKMIDEGRQYKHDLEIAQLTLKDAMATVQRLVEEQDGKQA